MSEFDDWTGPARHKRISDRMVGVGFVGMMFMIYEVVWGSWLLFGICLLWVYAAGNRAYRHHLLYEEARRRDQQRDDQPG